MKPVLSIIAGLVVALAVAALVTAAAFPDRAFTYLPDWAQRWAAPDGPQLVLQLEPDGVELGQAVDDSVKIIKRRLDDLGTRAVVEKQETDRILVQLSRLAKVEHVKGLLTRRGRLQVRLIDQTMTVGQAMSGQPPPGSEILYEGPDRRLPHLVEKRVVLSGRDLVDAQAGFDARTNEPVVSFRFNASGTRRFGQVTQENVGRALAVVFDGAVIMAPVIREPILGGMGQISGNFTVQAANEMAILLRAGELPGRLTVMEERSP